MQNENTRPSVTIYDKDSIPRIRIFKDGMPWNDVLKLTKEGDTILLYPLKEK